MSGVDDSSYIAYTRCVATKRKPGTAQAVPKPRANSRSSAQRQGSAASRSKAAQQSRTTAGKRSAQAADSRPWNKIEAERRLVAAHKQLAQELPRHEVDLIVKDSEQTVALIQTKEPRTSAVTGGMLPSPLELARIRKENLLRSFRERHLLLRDALTVKDVTDLLQVGRQTPHDRASAGTLLAIKDNGQLRFPAWQFDPEGSDGVIQGLPEVVQAMRGPISPLAKIKWFLTPKSLLAGRTPLDALREGNVEDVVTEASAIGAS